MCTLPSLFLPSLISSSSHPLSPSFSPFYLITVMVFVQCSLPFFFFSVCCLLAGVYGPGGGHWTSLINLSRERGRKRRDAAAVTDYKENTGLTRD